MGKLEFIKIINFFSVKALIKKTKKNAMDWEKYLQTTHLTNGWYLEYIKNSENSTVKKSNYPIRKWIKYIQCQNSGQQFWKTVLWFLKIKCIYHKTQQLHSWAFIPEKRRLTFTQKPVHKYLYLYLQ